MQIYCVYFQNDATAATAAGNIAANNMFSNEFCGWSAENFELTGDGLDVYEARCATY